MAEKYKKAPLQNSPKGVFKFPKLTKVDTGTKEFPKPDGQYKTGLVVAADREDVQKFIATLKTLHAAAVEAAKVEFAELKVDTRKRLQKENGKDGIKVNDFYTELFDKDTEEATGEIEFRFAMKASGERKDKSRWSQKPGIFDAHRQPLPKGIDVWGGTVGKVSFRAEPYFIPGTGMAGLSLKLEAVQVLELVSSGNRSGESYGFDEEEGFDASTVVVEETDEDAVVGGAKYAANTELLHGGDDGNF